MLPYIALLFTCFFISLNMPAAMRQAPTAFKTVAKKSVGRPQRRALLLTHLPSFPEVLINLIQEYEQITYDCFIPLKTSKFIGLLHKENTSSPYAYIFELTSQGLRCHEINCFKASKRTSQLASRYPAGWDIDKQEVFHGMLSRQFGCRIFKIKQSDHPLICGVDHKALLHLTTLLRMKTKIINVESQEYQTALKQSTTLFDPYSLDLPTLAQTIHQLYLQLNATLEDEAFQKTASFSDENEIIQFMKAYENSNAVQYLQQAPGGTSVLFHD